MGQKNNIQQLVIPKGLLSPDEAAVIEIPKRYNKAPVIVLRKREGEMAQMRANSYFVDANVTNPLELNANLIASGSRTMPRRYSRQISTTQVQQQVPIIQVASPPPPVTPTVTQTYSYTPSRQIVMPPPVTQVQQVPPQQVPTQYIYSPPPVPDYYSPQYQLRYNADPIPIVAPTCPGMLNLSNTERVEQENFRRSLEEFQRARRKFLGTTGCLGAKASQMSNSSSD